MRLTPIVFAGYASGQSDFEPVFNAGGVIEQQQLLGAVERIANTIIEPDSGQFNSLITIGHADRQDRSDMNCDQRRQSEADASRDRAVSAFEFVKAKVTERLAQSGINAGDFVETAPDFTWGLVFAGAGMLEHNPPTEAQRALNRRVVFLLSMKGP